MENKKLTIGALALGLGLTGLANACEARPEASDAAIAFEIGDSETLAGCNGECSGKCGSDGGDS